VDALYCLWSLAEAILGTVTRSGTARGSPAGSPGQIKTPVPGIGPSICHDNISEVQYATFDEKWALCGLPLLHCWWGGGVD